MRLFVTPRNENETELMVCKSELDPENLQFGYWKTKEQTLFENDKSALCKFKIKLKKQCIQSTSNQKN